MTRIVLLTAEDEQKFFSDTANNIILSTVDDSNGVFTEVSRDQIMNFLKLNLIDPGRAIIQNSSDANWQSVFWNNDNYRPDKVANTFNGVYKKLDKETKKKFEETFNNTNKVSASYAVGIPKIVEVSATLDTDFSRAGSTVRRVSISF